MPTESYDPATARQFTYHVIRDAYYFVSYHHIDDRSADRPLGEALGLPEDAPPVRNLRALLSMFFKEFGWRGDGEVRCIFIPPCFLGGVEDGWCKVIFHVKQHDNGTSFLAIPAECEASLDMLMTGRMGWFDSWAPRQDSRGLP